MTPFLQHVLATSGPEPGTLNHDVYGSFGVLEARLRGLACPPRVVEVPFVAPKAMTERPTAVDGARGTNVPSCIEPCPAIP